MVDASGRGVDASDVPTIASLLSAYKDSTGASYEEMYRRSGRVLSVARLQQLATAPPREFPKKTRTVEALATLLKVPQSTIVLAFAQSLGIAVTTGMSTLAVHLPPGTEALTDRDRDAILAVIRQLVDARNDPPTGPAESRLQGLRLAESGPLRAVTNPDS